MLAPGLWMLSIAPVVTLLRAAMVVAGITEPEWYWIGFAIGGSLSGLGTLFIGIALWGQLSFYFVLAGGIVAFIGHNVLPNTPLAGAGPSLVLLGSGVALAWWRPWVFGTGIFAGIASGLRAAAPIFANLLLVFGALGLLIAVVGAARAATLDRATAAQHAPTNSNMFEN